MNSQEFAKRFRDTMKRKYKEIGAIVFPERPATEDMTDEQKLEFSLDLLAGQAALATAMSGNITSLLKTSLVPTDLGEQLLLTARQLSIDLQKAIKAQSILRENPEATLVKPTLH